MKKLLVILIVAFASCAKEPVSCPAITEKGVDNTGHWFKTAGKYDMKFYVTEPFYNSKVVGDKSCE